MKTDSSKHRKTPNGGTVHTGAQETLSKLNQNMIRMIRERSAAMVSRSAKFQVDNILESVSDSFVALDMDWCHTYVNETAAQALECTCEQLVGRHIWTEFPEGVGQPFYKAYYQTIETEQPVFLEEYYPPYDRWFENRIYPSKEDLSIFFHNVTDRKKAELALQKAGRVEHSCE